MTRCNAWVAGLLALTLAGCASEPTSLALSDPAPGSVEQPVLVITTRQNAPDPALGFDGQRAKALAFADVTVMIPPDREPGEINYPNGRFDPRTDFTAARFISGLERQAFLADLNRRLAAQPPRERAAFIFVHGFNTDFAESVFLHAQIAHDFEAPGVPVSFSWASAGLPPAYLYDRESMQLARDGLVDALRLIAQSDADEIVLMGHSMGGALVMETLRQLSLERDRATLGRIDPVVLASPDVDADLFYQQYDRIEPKPDQFIMFVSRRDPALRVSQRLRGGAERIGAGNHVDELNARGIAVIDMTPLGGSPRQEHTKFASSPFIINMIRNANAVRGTLEGGPDDGIEQIAQGVADLGTSVADVILLPTQ